MKQINLQLTPKLIYLIEALKVEGYWFLKHSTLCIQNKNLPFLMMIENILKELGLNAYKRILVKIKLLGQEFTKYDGGVNPISSQ